MNGEKVDHWCERGILGLVLVILVLGPLALGAVPMPALLIIQALTMGVLALWVVRLWVSPKPQLLWPPLGWVVLAFAIYAIARYLTADIEYVARLEMILVLMYALLFFAIVNNLYRQEYSQVAVFTLIFLGMAISGYAVWQCLSHSNRVWIFAGRYPGRGSGTYYSPNNLAGFLEMLVPLGVAYVIAGRMKPVTRILLGYATLVLAAGLVATFSRGGWAATAIGMVAVLVVLIGHRNHRIPALLLLALLLAGGAFFVKNYLSRSRTYVERMEETASDGKVNLDLRRDLWRAAEAMWLDHFWWGVGPAHYDYRSRQYRSQDVQNRPDRAHNDYLNLLADWGTAGGLIVLAGMSVFGAGLARTWGHVRRVESEFGRGTSNRFAFFVGATGGLLALAAHSLVDFNLHIPANAILGVTLLALLTSNLRFATERYWLNLRLRFKAPLTLVLAVGVAYLAVQEWRLGAESWWLARAKSPALLALDRAAILEKAFAAEPKNFQTAYDIGEAYRMQSWEGIRTLNSEGKPEYAAQAQTAIGWYARAIQLDRYEGYNYLRTGMCLDQLDRHAEAEPFYRNAVSLDPNGYYTAANLGWHYFQVGDYAAARECFNRSLRLGPSGDVNPASTYLPMAEDRLLEGASGKSVLPAGW